MINEHLSDEQIQELAVDSPACEEGIRAHAQLCPQCSEKVEAYHLLITTIEKEPAPVFDFDVSEAVLTQIGQLKQQERRQWLYWLMAPGILLCGAALYLLWPYMAILFSGISMLLIGLALVSGLLIMVGVVIDMLKRYRMKMTELDLSN